MIEEKAPKIPSHANKKTIREKWFKNCPEIIIRGDMIEIHQKRGKSPRLHFFNKEEIQELFVDYGYGKPAMFEQEDYENYIKNYNKKNR